MITISSHVLDSVRGDHAVGIRVSARRVDDDSSGEPLFERHADGEGRIRVELEAKPGGWPLRIELQFHVAEYFSSATSLEAHGQSVEVAVVRLCLSDPDTSCHVPLVLSPHSYTVWWSATQTRPPRPT